MRTRADLTFKHNITQGRHGWLRLTPAYSIKVVHEIIVTNPSINYVLDPFSGTGTTGLVCAELGLNCDLLDINPFLIWFVETKTANYTLAERHETQQLARDITHKLKNSDSDNDLWFPPIKNIERWWPQSRRILLAQIYREIQERLPVELPTKNLLLIAFCRLVIEWSNAAFNHQSMSFKNDDNSLFDIKERNELLQHFQDTAKK